MSDYFKQFAVQSIFDEESVSSFTILSEIERKIKKKVEKKGVSLDKWGVQINYGIKTGLNKAFVIDDKTKEELILRAPKSEEVIRPLLRGRDIGKYHCSFENHWVILTKFGSHEYLESEYPSIYEHLKTYELDLKNRGQCRYTRSKKENNGRTYLGQHHWLELDNNPNQVYLDLFFSDKIIYPEITKFLNFYYDTSGFYTNNKCFILTGKNIAFLTAFFNSSLFKFCFRDSFPELLGGSRELRKIFFEKLPVIEVDTKTNLLFLDKIEYIQKQKQTHKKTKDLEMEIDDLIFDLYELTEEERAIIGFIEIQ